MAEVTLQVETELPFAWAPVTEPQDGGSLQGALLLLRLANQLETTLLEPEHDKLLDRLEAKLDLLLFWVGQSLFGDRPRPRPRSLILSSRWVEWATSENLMVGEAGILELYLHPRLAGPLRLAAAISVCAAGRARAEFDPRDEALIDAWTQWLFRCHRRAIQAAREGRDA